MILQCISTTYRYVQLQLLSSNECFYEDPPIWLIWQAKCEPSSAAIHSSLSLWIKWQWPITPGRSSIIYSSTLDDQQSRGGYRPPTWPFGRRRRCHLIQHPHRRSQNLILLPSSSIQSYSPHVLGSSRISKMMAKDETTNVDAAFRVQVV